MSIIKDPQPLSQTVQPPSTAPKPHQPSITAQLPPTAPRYGYHQPLSTASVLLIGSNGMGKSTLGNYLLDPDEKHMFDNPTFATATDNKPMTQEVKAISKSVQIDDSRSEVLTIIDNPGLNESADRDLSHMIDIIKNLNECEEIQACILVVKFNAKIDAQYKATMEYYSKLLPGLFDRNVIIVMTDYATDERSEMMRKRQRIDVEQVKRDTISVLGQCSNKEMTYRPQLFTIDCLPLGSAEMETSLTVRTAILNYIFKLAPIKVKSQMVAKTDYFKQKDAQEYEKLQGEIKGYSERLKQAHTDSRKALDDTHNKSREIIEIESKINNLETKLLDKDTTEDVVADHWSINEEWKTARMTREFNIKSPHEITKYTIWTNGGCEFKNLVQTSHAVSGRIEGKFMRGLYASVTAYTKMRIKYADEIAELKKGLVEENTNLTRCIEEWEYCKKICKEKMEEIELLEKYVDERRVAAGKCRSDFMTMEEAVLRLKKMQGWY